MGAFKIYYKYMTKKIKNVQIVKEIFEKLKSMEEALVFVQIVNLIKMIHITLQFMVKLVLENQQY